MSGILPCHHGTLTGYANYGCRCEPCREADRAYRRERRTMPIPNDVHGKVSTYNNLGCRCSRCREARTAYMREYRRQQAERGQR